MQHRIPTEKRKACCCPWCSLPSVPWTAPSSFSTGEHLALWVVFSVHRARCKARASKQLFILRTMQCVYIQTRGEGKHLPHMFFFPPWSFCLPRLNFPLVLFCFFFVSLVLQGKICCNRSLDKRGNSSSLVSVSVV